jgi:RNA polymerase sigma-70 factor (ECF subfamily)
LSKEQFRALIDNYSGRVLNIAVRILRDPEKARDVHQEVFLAIWKRWHNYNGQTNWDAYLYRVTVRKAIELARRSASERSQWQQRDDGISRDLPDGLSRAAELHRKLIESLSKLPKRQADVFVLLRIEGLKTEKVAGLLGCKESTVRVHLHRALKRLACELADYLAE